MNQKLISEVLAWEPSETSVPDLLRRAALLWPDETAMIFSATGERITFSTLARRVDSLAAELASSHGITKGDRVGLFLPNTIDFPLAWLGTLSIGAVAVPINRYLKGFELDELVRKAKLSLIVLNSGDTGPFGALNSQTDPPKLVLDCGSSERFKGAHSTVEPSNEDDTFTSVTGIDVANIQFTSGSTGEPKGCMVSHGYWVNIAQQLMQSGPKLRRSDILLTAQPFYYMDPMWNLTLALAAGCPLVVADRFHPSTFWETVRNYQVTFLYCLGVMPAMLLSQEAHPLDATNSLRYVACSGVPLDRGAELEEKFGVPWFELYGSTETGVDIIESEDDRMMYMNRCLGSPLANREVRVVDPDSLEPVRNGQQGLLLLRGMYTSEGYYADSEGNASAYTAGWYKTGDIVSRDAQGRIFFHERMKDIIRRSGENISAVQVESALDAHPLVDKSACLPEADDIRGEEIKAYISSSYGHEELMPKLIAFATERLAYFRVPRYWEVRTELPLTASGKVAKQVLRGTSGAQPVYDRVTQTWRPGREHGVV